MSKSSYFGRELCTIAAIATPLGRGSVGVVRISGPNTTIITKSLLGRIPRPRYAEYLPFIDADGTMLDKGLAIYFPAPNSFTGEDILELHGHGSCIVLDLILQRILGLGARLAKPGEFSERAFLNGKLDLVQAEAIADLIDANSEQSARAAIRSLQGDFSKFVNQLVEIIIDLRMNLETSIDFSDEPIDFFNKIDIKKKLNLLLFKIREIKKIAKQGILLQEGIQFVIVGPPNVGKSSLFNTLNGQDLAIVTPIKGTTRDIIRNQIAIDGLLIHLVDTAGLRKTDNEIEKEGIKRAFAEIEKADYILYVVDGTHRPLKDLESLREIDFLRKFLISGRLIVIRNKIDVTKEKACLFKKDNFDVINISVKTGEGLLILKNHIKSILSYKNELIENFSARRRHLQALDNAEQAISDGLEKIIANHFLELLAEDLAVAQNYLNEITGKFTTEDLLVKIFSNFCIGK